MQIFKGIAFGLLFSVAGTMGYLLLGIVIGILRGPISTGRAHATGLSAVVGGLLEATVFNPFYWLGIVLAFGLAFWITYCQPLQEDEFAMGLRFSLVVYDWKGSP